MSVLSFQTDETYAESVKPSYEKKIFLNHADSYHGKKLIKALSPPTENTFFDIYCTLGNEFTNEYEFRSNFRIKKILDGPEKDECFFQKIASYDYIIYDINFNDNQVAEAKSVLDTVEKYYRNMKNEIELDGGDINDKENAEKFKKYFILITTPLTWYHTPDLPPKKEDNDTCNDEDDEDDSEVCEDRLLRESDYRKRRNHPSNVPHKFLEREVSCSQKRCRPFLRTCILCPGFTYGDVNEIFEYVFKSSFYGDMNIPIFSACNYVPLLHINDFARIMRCILENFPRRSLRYILAVQPDLIPYRNFVRNICFAMGDNFDLIKCYRNLDALETKDELISPLVYNAVTMNQKMGLGYFCEMSFESSSTLEFYYKLVNEFRIQKKISPLKIVVNGPPASGKTVVAKFLEEHFNLKYIYIYDVVDLAREELARSIQKYKNFLIEEGINDPGVEEELDYDIEEMKAVLNAGLIFDPVKFAKKKLREWGKLSKYICKRVKKDGDYLDNCEDYDVFDKRKFRLVRKCLRFLLNTKSYSENCGYVLDDLPFEYNQMTKIFGSVERENDDETVTDTHSGTADECNECEGEVESSDEEEEDDDDEDENEEEEESIPKLPPINFLPNYAIILNASDDSLRERVMDLPEEEAVRSRKTEHEMQERLKRYRIRDEEETSVVTYLCERGVTMMYIQNEIKTLLDDLFMTIKEELGPPRKYPPSKKELARICEEEKKIALKTMLEEARLRQEAEAAERVAREEKLKKWTEHLEKLQLEEQEALEAKSIPLRQYLSKYVLPTLTDALVQIAEVKPEDPVEYLAEYLFKCNPTGRVIDPDYVNNAKFLLLDEDEIFKALDASQKDKSTN